MSETLVIEFMLFVAGGLITIAVANWREHRTLHDKIDTVHHSMRDRLDKIWKHMHAPKD